MTTLPGSAGAAGVSRALSTPATTTPTAAPTATVGTTTLPGEIGVFGPDDLPGAAVFLRNHGFAILRGLYDEATLAGLDAACSRAQDRLLAGELPDKHGTVKLVDDEDGSRTAGFANYVTYATEVIPEIGPAAREERILGVLHDVLGPDCWLLEGDPFGVVFQDSRPGSESSYTRIGWHSDWQSGPHLDRWPSVAWTLHLDGTSPANGFLRVVPGSHLWATPAPFRNANGAAVPEGSAPTGGYGDAAPPQDMPLGFSKVRGELAVYCERGDLLLHDAYLWHSAARATVDADDPACVRRHIRGGWYSNELDPAVTEADFVKNAAR
jgi:ectoine hydroxylase-related dioxygenase (phytanoyl-CoA dioxygenase family)